MDSQDSQIEYFMTDELVTVNFSRPTTETGAVLFPVVSIGQSSHRTTHRDSRGGGIDSMS